MSSPHVSIIINNYNYERFLKQAIDSALNQTYSDLEVIVVDDGSEDESRNIIESYGNAIIPIFKQNKGQASAINAGFVVSQGEIIMLLDADDYLLPYAVEQVALAWKPDTVQVQSRLKLVDAEGNQTGVYPQSRLSFDSGNVCSLLLEKGRYRTTVTSGLSFSRSVLNQVLPIPEAEYRLSADGYLVTTVPFYGRVVSIDLPLGAYRRHGNNLWMSGQTTLAEKFRKYIQHDFLRYKSLEKKAAELGKTISQDIGLKDYSHLIFRIASLRLDPKNHPVSADSRLMLAYMGYWTIWQYSKFSIKKKLILSFWFIWVGIQPQYLAVPAINWFKNSQSRPKTLVRLLKQVRSVI